MGWCSSSTTKTASLEQSVAVTKMKMTVQKSWREWTRKKRKVKKKKKKKAYLQQVEVDWPQPSRCFVAWSWIARIDDQEKDRSHLSSRCALSASPATTSVCFLFCFRYATQCQLSFRTALWFSELGLGVQTRNRARQDGCTALDQWCPPAPPPPPQPLLALKNN